MNNNGHKPKSVQKLQPYEYDLFNRKLRELYGELNPIMPYFRLVWANDSFELRKMTHTDEGFELIYPEVRQVRKYQDKNDRYVLEGLQEIPPNQETDLVTRLTYEPIWTFQDAKGEYLIPIWPAVHHIMETLKANVEGRGTGIPDEAVIGIKETDNPEEALQMKKQRIDKLCEELFGNETSVTDALTYGRGVTVPGSTSEEKE